jgi:hypothetical protein
MSKMKNLSVVENEIFAFLRSAFSLNKTALKQGFLALFEKLKRLEGSPMESRSFMYLDILSWLESKIKNVPVQEVISSHFRIRAASLTSS